MIAKVKQKKEFPQNKLELRKTTKLQKEALKKKKPNQKNNAKADTKRRFQSKKLNTKTQQ